MVCGKRETIPPAKPVRHNTKLTESCCFAEFNVKTLHMDTAQIDSTAWNGAKQSSYDLLGLQHLIQEIERTYMTDEHKCTIGSDIHSLINK